MGNVYGSSIVNGVPRFSSASSLTTFDPNSFGGCNRKWWIEKILKCKQEETEAMRKGTNLLHKPIDAFYETGVESFPPLALAVRRYMYERGPDLLIEAEIGVPIGAPKPTEAQPMTDAQLAVAPVKAGGIPIVGRMDLVQARGYYIDANGELQKEPRANTVEVNDWKSTSDEAYAKTTEQLRSAVQMITYGEAVITDDPAIENVRLSHTYSLTKGASRGFKRTVLVPSEEVVKRWEYVGMLGRSMRDVAAEANIEKVPANRNSCNAWGRKGCPFKSPQPNGDPPLCSAGRFNSLTSLFGEAGSKYLLEQADEQTQEVIPTMSILNRVNAQAPAAGATGVALPTVTPVNTPAAVGVQLAMGTVAPSMLDVLEAEEAAAAAPAPTLTQQHVDAFSVIALAEMGYPKNTGEASALLAAYGAMCSPPRAYSADGAGRLSGLNVHTTGAELVKLAEDLKAHAAKKAAAAQAAAPAPAPTPKPTPTIALPTAQPAAAPVVAAAPAVQSLGILSNEAPASNPALAALPVEGMAPPPAQTTIALPTTPAPAPAPQPTPTIPLPAAAPEAPKAAKPPKPPKAKGAAKAIVTEGSTLDGKPAGTVLTVTATEEPFELYIDCIPSKSYESLDGYISQWCTSIVNLLQNKEYDFPDIRTLSDKRADFGKWPGVLAALVRECALEGQLPRGVYVVHTKGSAINACVAEALSMVRREDGTPVLDFYVKGF